jgi:phospholipase C
MSQQMESGFLGRVSGVLLLVCAGLAAVLGATAMRAHQKQGHGPAEQGPSGEGIHKIKHVIIVMQENRSFDSYFGTYPGADGLPGENGRFTVCVPNPATGNCEPPYHDKNDRNGGGPHGQGAAVNDIDGGKMDGFIAQAEKGQRGCLNPDNPACTNSATPDVMG